MAQRLEGDLGFLLARAHRAMRRWLLSQLDPLGVTYEQFVVLAHLWDEANLSQSELAQRAFLDKSSLARILRRMERAGLVSREPDATDARMNRVNLTSRGRNLQSQIEPLRDEGLRQAVEDLDEEEVRELGRLLDHIHMNMIV
jgi:DNA-binding MarR family transcriptional regulator